MVNPWENDRVYERLQLIVNGPALFNAIVTGLELDVFGHLSRHDGETFDELRKVTGLDEHPLRVLMFSLCATELVDKVGDRYANSPVAEDMLATEKPESWRDTLIGWRRFQYPAFTHATDALRSGTNAALRAYPGEGDTLYARLAHDPELVGAYHDSIAPFTHLFLPALVEHPELGSLRHLLDVGGGDGTTATHFVRRHPHSRVTIFDMPSVASHAELSVPADVADRVGLCPGDLFMDPFPSDVDGVLFSHVLEPFSAEQSITLLTKAFEALAPGGKLFTYGMTASDDERRGLLSARLSLYLNVLVSKGGMAHPVKDYESWLRAAGCAEVRCFTGLSYEHSLIVGTKK